METDDDNIFGRFQNEMREIEEQKKRNEQKVKDSQKHWLSEALLNIGQFLGKLISWPFEFLSDLIEDIFK